MLSAVALRSEQSLFFAGPERDADGATRLDSERFQDAHGFHRYDGSCSVIGGAGSGDPAIKMAAEHHNLVLQLRIGAGDFGDGVIGVFVFAGEFGIDIDLDAYGRHEPA